MSLLLAGLVCAGASGAFAITRWFARSRQAETEAESTAAAAPPPAAEPPLVGFPCQLGDVVMRPGGEEAWLAGALVFSEGVAVAALFVAPDANRDRAIYASPAPQAALVWLAPLDPGAVLVAGEPPSAVEHDDVRFERVRRLPLRVARRGVGAPDVGASAVVAEYAGPGSERLVVLLGQHGTFAYRGEALREGSYEVVASGASTLDAT